MVSDPPDRAEVVSRDGHGLLVVQGLPSPPSQQTYQLWFMKGRQPVGAETFDTSDGLTVKELRGSPRGYTGVAVTVEPAGGSRRPTSAPILSS